MYCFSAFHVLLCMILYQQTPVVYLQSLVLTVETSPLKCGEEVKLKCSYSGATCCTDDARVWTRDGVQIMSNGIVSDNAKYEEERNDASLHFDMKILNLDDTDFDKVFQCNYFFQTSNPLTLSKDPTYQCHPSNMGSCPFTVSKAKDKMRIDGTLNITKVAPSPVLHAFYGVDNITSDFITTELINYDTWYYFLTANIDKDYDCKGRNKDKFTAYVTIGSTTTKICQSDFCACGLCGLYCWLISAIIPVIACLIVFAIYYKKFCTEDETCRKKCEIFTLIWLGLTLLLNAALPVPIGIHHCPCEENWWFLFNFTWSFGTGLLIAFLVCLARYDLSYIRKRDTTLKIKMIALGFVTSGAYLLAAPVFDKKLLKGGNNQSTESGSSCWPPCSVGQDPISPDPENAKSLLKKKRADKITEEKPVAVVISQPPKARHVMTDNTESTKYSTEKEKFSAGLDKGKTTRPLPSIGQPTDSPRPLPQMPQGNQQEKGGIQLQPLGDSTEKKKKKKRKKKAIKDSDEED